MPLKTSQGETFMSTMHVYPRTYTLASRTYSYYTIAINSRLDAGICRVKSDRKKRTTIENERRQDADANERARYSRSNRNEHGLCLSAPRRVSRRYHSTAVYMPLFLRVWCKSIPPIILFFLHSLAIYSTCLSLSVYLLVSLLLWVLPRGGHYTPSHTYPHRESNTSASNAVIGSY